MNRPSSVDHRLARAVRPIVENLETRTFLSASMPIPTGPASLLNGTLLVQGTTGNDTILIKRSSLSKLSLDVTVNKTVSHFTLADVKLMRIYGLTGNDSIIVDEGNGIIATKVWAFGSNGNDTIQGGSGSDTLIGGNGDDLLRGQAGGDWIEGNDGNDRLLGGDNIDTLLGGAGRDLINTGAGRDDVRSTDNLDSVDTGGAADTSVNKKLRGRPQPARASTGGATPAAYNASVVGYTPAQVRKGYGFGDLTSVKFKNRGQGQTIAIVVAYDYRTAREDLNTFSRTFGLPEVGKATFGRMYASGVQPFSDPLWSSEAAMDLQWAHAIAPAARLVLVEADSDLPADLMNAVAKATNLLHDNYGGGVVSMSFGFPESRSDAIYSTIFRNSRTGDVSFVAAAGNIGGQVFYPAVGEEALAVGGTFLPLDSDGNLTGPETAWIDGGGGASAATTRFRPVHRVAVHPRPEYQNQLQVGGAIIGTTRVVPDVAYNADPLAGYAVFDSTPNENGDTGWQAIGGTSAGTPQWAGITALANQMRVANGLTMLGNGQLNNFIYGLARKNQLSLFNDITLGSNGNAATPGFDEATGWGTPKAAALIAKLGTATSKAPRVSTTGVADFKWQANFTREMLNGLLTVPAVISFGGEPGGKNIGNARFSTTTVSLRFIQDANEITNKGTIELTAFNLPRTGNDFSGQGTGVVLLNDGTPGIFNMIFSGRLARINGQDTVSGEFYAIGFDGKILPQGANPILRGVFAMQGGTLRP